MGYSGYLVGAIYFDGWTHAFPRFGNELGIGGYVVPTKGDGFTYLEAIHEVL